MANPFAIIPASTSQLAKFDVDVPRGPFGRDQFELAALSVIVSFPSPYTRRAYKADLRRWLAFCDAHDVQPAMAPLAAAAAFRDELAAAPGRHGAPMARATVRRACASLASIDSRLAHGSGGKAVTSNPFHRHALQWPDAGRVGKTPVIDAATAEAMIAVTIAPRDLAFLRLLYDTGMRRSSAVTARRDRLRTTGTQVELLIDLKGNREAYVEFNQATTAAVQAWLAVAPPSPWIFPGKDPLEHFNPMVANKIVAQASAKLGTHVHPHQFRATFITDGYAAGLPEREIQAGAHHLDSASTQRYDRSKHGAGVVDRIAAFRKNRDR